VAIFDEVARERGDLSPFIVHLTRGEGEQARLNLVSILTGKVIEAQSVFGLAQARALAEQFDGTPFAKSQRAVCFTETPLPYLRHMCRPITTRQKPLRDYGVVFTRGDARAMGINPVWYLDTTRGGSGRPSHEWLTDAFREAYIAAVKAATPPASENPDPVLLAGQPIFKLTPFIETMGPTSDRRPKEF
jgi:hypothetical protein